METNLTNVEVYLRTKNAVEGAIKSLKFIMKMYDTHFGRIYEETLIDKKVLSFLDSFSITAHALYDELFDLTLTCDVSNINSNERETSFIIR